MKNLTKALVASGLLLSISGCSEQVMDCLANKNISETYQILGVDRGGQPVTTLGVDRGGQPITTLGVDRGGQPVTTLGVDRGGQPITTLGVDRGGQPSSSYHDSSIDSSIAECLLEIDTDIISIAGVDRGGQP